MHLESLQNWFVFICEFLEKVLDFLCAQTVSENRKVPQDVSAMAFSVLCLCWKVLSAALEICVLRLDKEVVKLRGLYLIENTMWSSCFLGPSSSPDAFNGTDEEIETVLGVLLMKLFFSSSFFIFGAWVIRWPHVVAEPWELHWPTPAFVWSILPGLCLNEIALGSMDFWVQSI